MWESDISKITFIMRYGLYDEPESINWTEFRVAFRAHLVPQGVIKLKKEFQDPK
jgi:hypothetical protein